MENNGGCMPPVKETRFLTSQRGELKSLRVNENKMEERNDETIPPEPEETREEQAVYWSSGEC